MKKIILTAALVAASLTTYAQVGVGNTSPKATLEVTGKPTDAAVADGIMAPRLTANQLLAKTAYVAADNNAALVYVTAAPTTAGTGNFVNVTTEGYYYLDVAGVWQKVATGSENLWIKEGANIAKLNLAGSKEEIRYTNERFEKYSKLSPFIQSSTGGVLVNDPISSYNAKSISSTRSDELTVVNPGTIYDNFNHLTLPGSDTNAGRTFVQNSNNLFVAPENTTNYGELVVSRINLDVQGSGTLSRARGIFNQVGISSNSRANEILGINTRLISFSSQNTSAAVADQLSISLRGTGGFGNMSMVTGVLSNAVSSSNIANLTMFNSNIALNSGYTGTISNSYDFYANASNFGGGTITNEFGMYILGANKRNYFQGKLGIGTTNPVEALSVVGDFKNTGTATIGGNTQIGLPSTPAQLTIFQTGDNNIVLRLGIERAWDFKQENTGGSANLVLQTATGGKDFKIKGATGDVLAMFNTENNLNSNRVHFVTDGGAVSVGSYVTNARLDVDGYIKVGSSDVLADAAIQFGTIRYNATTGRGEMYVANSTAVTAPTPFVAGWRAF